MNRKRRHLNSNWPPDFAEISARAAKREMREWLQPKSGDLLADVRFLQLKTTKEKDPQSRGVYARSMIVMSVATIEAITNDALATIYDLLTDSIPSECANTPPWCHFIGRSTRRIKSLLQKGAFLKKQEYVLSQIERVTGRTLEGVLLQDIDRLRNFRNRIVHMNFLQRRSRYQSVLNSAQATHIAKGAYYCAHQYLEFLSEEFSELNLPIVTVRSFLGHESEVVSS